ncbi:hypothetical protein BJX64DRAFT_278482 [Aspergillus heterothallicus]
MPRSTRTTGGRHSEQCREYDTQSLTESVTQYPIENGRTYHKYHEGSYVYPNDEREMNRLDMQHHMCKLLTGGRLFLAPLRNPRNIVDIGTGSGIWPIELASIFPNAQITGTDLSPCQPDEVPENVHFIVDDCREDWLWNQNSLDYIHAGHMSGALPSYKDLLRKMFDHLKPGGWAECQEFDTMVKSDDGTMPPLTDELGAYPFQDWCDLQIRAGQSTDPPRQFRVAHRIARGMRDIGFIDVQEYIFKAPVNPWSPDPQLHTIGKWNESNILEALSGWSYKPLTTLSWSKPEIEVFLVQVRKSVQDRHLGYPMSLGTCAYRHAIRSTTSTTATPGHVWISDELLASTFRRFIGGQRRYESRVPGPLEARRRLAKRRNTALASVSGPGILDDVACLFGRNGREHMKWTNGQGRPADCQNPLANALAPLDEVYIEGVGTFESQNPFFSSSNAWNADEEVSNDPSVEEQIQQCQTVSELRSFVRALDLDLRREPEYSRLAFNHLLSQFVSQQTAVDELLLFLDDRNLNVPEAGNYLGIVEHFISCGATTFKKDPLFGAVIRGLELGLISATEIRQILERLSDVSTSKQDTRMFLRQCGIYGHRDLDSATLDSDYRLARDVLLDAGQAVSNPSSWLQRFIIRWLVLTEQSQNDGDYVAQFLEPFTADLVASQKAQLLQRWMDWLPKLQNVFEIASSPVWTDVRVLHSCTSHKAPLSPRHQILQRLWVLHIICKRCVRRAGRHPTIDSLYRLYDMARREGNEDLWNNFIKGIHDLKLPWQDLRATIYYMRRPGNPERFESIPLSFTDIFEDLSASTATSHIFFHNMKQTICRMDITGPAFLEYALLIVQIRILRSHIPLQIAISQAWHLADPASMALIPYNPKPRSAYNPDPQACLHTIHTIASAAFQLHNAPIRPKMARALYHAGIVRFRRQGLRIATDRYNFIWDLVETTENPEIVRTLLQR